MESMVLMKLFCRAAIKTHREQTLTQGGGRKEKMGCMDRVSSKLIFPYVKKRASGNLLYVSGNSKQGSNNLEGGTRREMGGRFRREGTYVYLWLIHVEVWLKPVQFCKAIILQLKKKIIA